MIMCIAGQVSYMYHYMGDLDCKVVEMEMSVGREGRDVVLCVGALNDFLVGLNTNKSRSATYLRTLLPPLILLALHQPGMSTW